MLRTLLLVTKISWNYYNIKVVRKFANSMHVMIEFKMFTEYSLEV